MHLHILKINLIGVIHSRYIVHMVNIRVILAYPSKILRWLEQEMVHVIRLQPQNETMRLGTSTIHPAHHLFKPPHNEACIHWNGPRLQFSRWDLRFLKVSLLAGPLTRLEISMRKIWSIVWTWISYSWFLTWYACNSMFVAQDTWLILMTASGRPSRDSRR